MYFKQVTGENKQTSSTIIATQPNVPASSGSHPVGVEGEISRHQLAIECAHEVQRSTSSASGREGPQNPRVGGLARATTYYAHVYSRNRMTAKTH